MKEEAALAKAGVGSGKRCSLARLPPFPLRTPLGSSLRAQRSGLKPVTTLCKASFSSAMLFLWLLVTECEP